MALVDLRCRMFCRVLGEVVENSTDTWNRKMTSILTDVRLV